MLMPGPPTPADPHGGPSTQSSEEDEEEPSRNWKRVLSKLLWPLQQRPSGLGRHLQLLLRTACVSASSSSRSALPSSFSQAPAGCGLYLDQHCIVIVIFIYYPYYCYY